MFAVRNLVFVTTLPERNSRALGPSTLRYTKRQRPSADLALVSVLSSVRFVIPPVGNSRANCGFLTDSNPPEKTPTHLLCPREERGCGEKRIEIGSETHFHRRGSIGVLRENTVPLFLCSSAGIECLHSRLIGSLDGVSSLFPVESVVSECDSSGRGGVSPLGRSLRRLI